MREFCCFCMCAGSSQSLDQVFHPYPIVKGCNNSHKSFSCDHFHRESIPLSLNGWRAPNRRRRTLNCYRSMASTQSTTCRGLVSSASKQRPKPPTLEMICNCRFGGHLRPPTTQWLATKKAGRAVGIDEGEGSVEAGLLRGPIMLRIRRGKGQHGPTPNSGITWEA